MTLSFYFARRFLTMFLQVFIAFLVVLLVFDIIETLRRFSGSAISVGEAVQLSLLNMPASMYRILPLVMMLSSVAMFLGLARSSELVVVRAAGRSGLRFLAAPLATALAIGIVAVSVGNPFVAATAKRYDHLVAARGTGGGAALSVSADGLWMRQGNADGQSVIMAQRASPDGARLFGVTFLIFGADGTAESRVAAAEATLSPGEWVLKDAKRWDLKSANPERDAVANLAELRLRTDITPDRIREGFATPRAMSVWNLPSFISDLEVAGFSAQTPRVWLQMELALPLLLMAMVLVAAGFTMRHARFGKSGQMVLYAVVGGFFIFFLRNFAQVLGESGQIPIALAAWSPPIAAIMLSLGLLLHLEDG